MARVSKAKIKLHFEACELVDSDEVLTLDQREFILENWNPMVSHNVTWNAAFFTPMSVTNDFMMETLNGDKRVVDLCAGIGRLAYAMWKRNLWYNDQVEIVCVERDPEFIKVGKRVLPEATWVRGDIFDESTWKELGRFDEAISNPPYGLKVEKNEWLKNGPSQFMAAEVAMKLAPVATFLLAQSDCPFQFSGVQSFRTVENNKYEKWSREVGVVFQPNCGLDLSYSAGEWDGLSKGMMFEIVNVERVEVEEPGIEEDDFETNTYRQASMFDENEMEVAA